MEIKVTPYEFEEAKQSMTVMKPQEVDYIASFYRASREVAELRRHIADIGEAMRTKANNNPDGVKASTLEMLGEELLAALPSTAELCGGSSGPSERAPG